MYHNALSDIPTIPNMHMYSPAAANKNQEMLTLTLINDHGTKQPCAWVTGLSLNLRQDLRDEKR
jgi:hypothetical protein